MPFRFVRFVFYAWKRILDSNRIALEGIDIRFLEGKLREITMETIFKRVQTFSIDSSHSMMQLWVAHLNLPMPSAPPDNFGYETFSRWLLGRESTQNFDQTLYPYYVSQQNTNTKG